MRWTRSIPCLVMGGVGVMQLTVAGAQAPRTLGAARYVAPSGWTEDRKPTVHSFSRVSARDVCLLAIYVDEVSPPSLAAAFEGAWRGVFNPRLYRRAELPAGNAQLSPAGYRHLAGDGEVEDINGNRWVARLFVFPAAARTQTVALIGNSRGALDGCRADVDAFFTSLQFPAETRAVAPTPPDAPVTPAPPNAPVSPTARDATPISSTGSATPSAPLVFENVTYVPPPGWRSERAGNTVVLTPTTLLPGEALQLVILPGRRSDEPLARSAAATWTDVAAMLGAQSMTMVSGAPFDLDEPGRARRGWDYLSGHGGMRRADGAFSVRLYLIRAGDRVERVAVIARDFRAKLMTINAAQNPVHERAIRAFVFSLRFANVRDVAAALPHITPGKGIAGVWGGITMSFGRYKPTFAILFDDGTAYFGPSFPTGGLHEIDPAIEQPAAPRYWGTYTVSGASGEIRMPYGAIPLRVTERGIEFTTSGTVHRFIRLEMPGAAELVGQWCLVDGQCIRFTADGRFQDDGAARVMEHATYDYPETPEGGDGTFVLQDHSLILRYDRGPEIRIAVPGIFERPAAGLRELSLSFNQDKLLRR